MTTLPPSTAHHRLPRGLAAALVLATWLAFVPRSQAQAPGASSLECVLGLAIGRDGSDPALAIEALTTMGEALSERGIRLVVSAERECLNETTADACAPLLEASGCDAILVVTVDPSGPQRPSPVLSLDLYDTRGAELGISRAFTSSPTLVAANLVNEAIQQWDEVQPMTWRIEGTPEGAAVQVDRVLGTIPYVTTVRPGTHRVTVRAPGFVTHSENITLEAGEETFVTRIELEPDDGPAEASTPHSITPWQRIVGPIMVGVGVAAAAAVVIGSVATLDDDVVSSTGVTHEELAVGPTFAYAGLGLAVATAGVILWLTAPDAPTEVRVGAGHVSVSHRF